MALMDAAIAKRLIELNRGFYQTLADPFSATRGRLQPGVQRVLAEIPLDARILDLGCGNGNLAAALAERGQRGVYLGLDFSVELVFDAAGRLGKSKGRSFAFKVVDLTENWTYGLEGHTFDYVLAFAVLHHIPSANLRLSLLQEVRSLLAPDGRFIHSNWQFMNSERLRARIQPWSSIDLSEAQVDAGDYLLDWRSGGSALRYVHQFSERELTALAAAAGFRVERTFLSDGESGELGLYGVWVQG
jgi:SAM-dependent methyltransferase